MFGVEEDVNKWRTFFRTTKAGVGGINWVERFLWKKYGIFIQQRKTDIKYMNEYFLIEYNEVNYYNICI